jgi:hypothetical protein
MTAIYGCTATAIGIVTIHQGRKTYMIWQAHHHRQANEATGTSSSMSRQSRLANLYSDLELGRNVTPPTATTLDNSEDAVGVPSYTHTEEQASTATPDRAADEAYTAVTALHLLPASPTQQAYLPVQSTTQTMASEASLGPSLGHGAGSDLSDSNPSAPIQPDGDSNITPSPDQHNDDNTAIR